MSDSEEEIIEEEEADGGPAALKKLRERLKKAVEEKQEYLEGWQRARADFANYKREEAGLHRDREERTKAQFVETLLPALDAVHMALRHATSKDLELVQKQLLDSLKAFGVEQFGTAGEPFDPKVHEALREAPTDAPEKDHTVLSVERPGYRISEHLVRPAQVSVNVYKK